VAGPLPRTGYGCYPDAMVRPKTIFDDADEAVESAAIERAREEIAAGEDLSQEVVGAWLQWLAAGEIVPPPTSD